MSNRKYFWSGLQAWVTNLFRKNFQPTTTVQTSVEQEVITDNKSFQSIKQVENFKSLSLHQRKREAPTSIDIAKSSVILGLDNVNDLETVSSQSLINLIVWDYINHNTNISGFSLIDELAPVIPEITSTEDILETVKWDSAPFTNVKPVATASRNSCFLLGLDDIVNLESLLSQDLFQLMSWEVDNYTNLTIEAEDLSLLEDLLNDFPD